MDSGDLCLHPTLKCKLCGFVKHNNVRKFRDFSRAERLAIQALTNLRIGERNIVSPVVEDVATPQMFPPHDSSDTSVIRRLSHCGLSKRRWCCVEESSGGEAEESELSSSNL